MYDKLVHMTLSFSAINSGVQSSIDSINFGLLACIVQAHARVLTGCTCTYVMLWLSMSVSWLNFIKERCCINTGAACDW